MKTKNVTKLLSLATSYIQRKENFGFGEVNFLPRPRTKLLNSLSNATAVHNVGFGKKEVVSKE